jgi:hypothetical protein
MKVTWLEVKAQFEACRCEEALKGREGGLTEVAFVGGDHRGRNTGPVRKLLLSEPGFETGQGQD